MTIYYWIWWILLGSSLYLIFHESMIFTCFTKKTTFKNCFVFKLFKFCRNFISPFICRWKFDRQIFVFIFQLLLKENFNQIVLLFVIRYNFYTLPCDSFLKTLISWKNLKTPTSVAKWRLKSINLSFLFSF